MPTKPGTKRLRKNMNLSAKVFAKLEAIKRREEREIGIPLPWDNFFSRWIGREKARTVQK